MIYSKHTRLKILFTVFMGFSPIFYGEEAANDFKNAGFEEMESAGRLAEWTSYHKGYEVDRRTVRSGRQSIRVDTDSRKSGAGVVQTITYESPDRRPVIFGGWCKTENVGAGGDLSVYLDIIYEDGTPGWATASWSRGTRDWEYSAQIHRPAKPVREITAYVFLRGTTGTAWFDDVKLHRGGLHVLDVCAASDSPRTRSGVRLTARLTRTADWVCSLLDESGTVLDTVSGSGNKILWFWPGHKEEGARPATARIQASADTGKSAGLDVPVQFSLPDKNPVTGDRYAVWTESSMRKVYPVAVPPGRGGEGRLDLARRERESLQIAVKPSDTFPLKGVRLDIGEFKNEAGAVFPADQIQWHVVGYVWVQEPSGHPSAPGTPNWCPDVLLPAGPVDILHGRTQSFWLQFFAAEDVKPGLYRGTVSVRPEGAEAQEIELSVRVRSFSLPVRFSMKTAFSIMDGFLEQSYGRITPELRRQSLDIMLEHRLNPDDISRTVPPQIEDLLYARERGMNAFNILNLVPQPQDQRPWVCRAPFEAFGPELNAELAGRLDGYIDELRKHNLTETAYFYGFDERDESYDKPIKETFEFLKKRYPEISTFTTAGYIYYQRQERPRDYQDWVDWYCPLTARYDPDLSERLRSRGKEVWWYVSCFTKYPYANFASMDYPSIEGRLLPWMTWGFHSDGLLYWHVNYWGSNPVIDTQDPYLADWTSSRVDRMTGDGILIYPTAAGLVSSIRLQNIRDGIEDYEYLVLLTDLMGRRAALRYFDRMVESMIRFSRDPDDLYAARKEMADRLESLLETH